MMNTLVIATGPETRAAAPLATPAGDTAAQGDAASFRSMLDGSQPAAQSADRGPAGHRTAARRMHAADTEADSNQDALAALPGAVLDLAQQTRSAVLERGTAHAADAAQARPHHHPRPHKHLSPAMQAGHSQPIPASSPPDHAAAGLAASSTRGNAAAGAARIDADAPGMPGPSPALPQRPAAPAASPQPPAQAGLERPEIRAAGLHRDAPGADDAPLPAAVAASRAAAGQESSRISSAMSLPRTPEQEPAAAITAAAAAAAVTPATPGLPMAAAPGLASTLAVPFGQPEWPQQLGHQVAALATRSQQGEYTAELRLDPPELGPLRITLSLQDGVATALFSSAHAHVRQAVENALPQLAQQLAASGIALGHADVGSHEHTAQHGPENSPVAPSGSSGNGGQRAAQTPLAADTTARPLISSSALVDTYA